MKMFDDLRYAVKGNGKDLFTVLVFLFLTATLFINVAFGQERLSVEKIWQELISANVDKLLPGQTFPDTLKYGHMGSCRIVS